MKAISSLAALHLLCLALCVPLFMIYASNGNTDTRSEGWTFFAIAFVYGSVIATNRPGSVYDGAFKFGLKRRVVKCAFASVALITLSVPLMDNSNQVVSIVGLGCLIGAAPIFVFAARVVLSVEGSSKD